MQRIDYWVGVPLCAVFALVDRIVRPFRRKKAAEKPKKILFIELSEMGSAILAYSALKRAEEDFQAKVYFMIFRRNRESLDLLRFVPPEQVFEIEDSGFWAFTRSVFKTLPRLWREGIDTTIDMELFSRCTALLSYLSGAVRRVGFHNGPAEGLYRGSFITHRVLYNPHQHISLNFLNLLYALEQPNEEPYLKRDLSKLLVSLPKYGVTDAELDRMREVVKAANPALPEHYRLMVLNPDPGLLPLRGWSLDNYVAVARQAVTEFPDTVVAVVGLGRSKGFADEIGAALPKEHFVDLTGKTANLRELVVLLEEAALILTNDSGPAHFAALTPVPILVLFGPETPYLYAPLGDKVWAFFAHLGCSPCYSAYNHRTTECKNNLCLQSILVDEVYGVVKQVLEGK